MHGSHTKIELSVCGAEGAQETLLQWDHDQLTAGRIRAWLQENVWANYGSGLWNEPWSIFMSEFAAAVQSYAHYGRDLAQWQLRLLRPTNTSPKEVDGSFYVEYAARAYDPQKATRISLFHSILTYVLGRILIAAEDNDPAFRSLVTRLGVALSKSRYLDGHETEWSRQFWAMLWETSGKTILE